MIYDQNRIELSLQTIVDKPRQAGAFRQVSGVTTVLVIPRYLNVVVQGIWLRSLLLIAIRGLN